MQQNWKGVGSFGTIGLEVVLSMLLGLFAGRWLDARLHTGPYLAVVGFLFGCAAGANAIVRSWKEMRAIAQREEREEGNPPPQWESAAERESGRDASDRRASVDDADDADGARADDADVPRVRPRANDAGEEEPRGRP